MLSTETLGHEGVRTARSWLGRRCMLRPGRRLIDTDALARLSAAACCNLPGPPTVTNAAYVACYRKVQ